MQSNLDFKSINNDQINYLNIFLMLFSFLLALLYPFEVFLISFIIVGPLHYLTEISWLQKKQFFIVNKSNVVLLVLIVTSFGFYLFSPNVLVSDYFNILLFSTLVYAITMAFTTNFIIQLASFAGSFLLAYLVKWQEQDWFLTIFAIFLPTIIHITIFTGLFILSGILKNKTVAGWLSLACFLICSFGFFVLPFFNSNYQPLPYARELYGDFMILNRKFSDFFHFGQINSPEDVFVSMQFIAFGYTYHYLNWFTKTSVIKWHEVSKYRMLAMAIVYLAVLGVYFYDKMIGVWLLSTLSIAHIILEFPLNGLTLKAFFKR
jgi:hypothetical protein